MIPTAELVALASPIIASSGMAYYFAPPTLARGTEFGLDGLSWYIIGRGGPMGDTDPAAVAAAFGYFNPQTVIAAWNAAKDKIEPRRAGAEYLACGAEFGRTHLADVERTDALAEALLTVQRAADPQGLALYAAYAAEPVVDDAPGRTMQLLTKLRELRGSAHLLANRAVGLDPRTAHFVTRPEMYKMFGWDESDPPAVDDTTQALREKSEALTDALVTPAFDVLDESGRQALVEGLRAVKQALRAPAAPNR